MTQGQSDFQPVEIDEVDRKIGETAVRKRIPSIKVEDVAQAPNPVEPSSRKTISSPSPRKSLSLEVPDYLATRLKIDAAEQSVTVRHLVLSALVDAGYEVKAIDIEEDGRRLR